MIVMYCFRYAADLEKDAHFRIDRAEFLAIRLATRQYTVGARTASLGYPDRHPADPLSAPGGAV
jgi:hypothetical protein